MIFIIKKFLIIIFIFLNITFNTSFNLYSKEVIFDDYGIIGLMYHRFEENKYPSTNIRMKDFKDQINLIKSKNIEFVNPHKFNSYLKNSKAIGY